MYTLSLRVELVALIAHPFECARRLWHIAGTGALGDVAARADSGTRRADHDPLLR